MRTRTLFACPRCLKLTESTQKCAGKRTNDTIYGHQPGDVFHNPENCEEYKVIEEEKKCQDGWNGRLKSPVADKGKRFWPELTEQQRRDVLEQGQEN